MNRPPTPSRSLDDLLGFQRYFVAGANSGGDIVRRWLEARGNQIAAFVEPRALRRAASRDGLEVVAAEDLPALLDHRSAVVIGTVRHRETGALLIDRLGIPLAQIFPFVNAMFAAHYMPGVQQTLATARAAIRTALADEASRAHFDRVLAFYETLDPRWLDANPNCIGHYGYDAPGANPAPGASIVDCGAHTGDTFDEFLKATAGDCRIFALEAFLPNVIRLAARIDAGRLGGIVTPLHLAASGERAHAVVISGDPLTADATAGIGVAGRSHSDIVLGETLDALFLERLPRRIDYLKIDIEGGDLDALKGATRLLQTHRPVVAVAAYHTPGHVTEIPAFLLKALGPCRLYAGHDPQWKFHIHYIAVPDERAAPA